jgi:hypothetical protein
MSELEDLLKEVAQKVLGLPSEVKDPGSSRNLKGLPLNFTSMPAAPQHQHSETSSSQQPAVDPPKQSFAPSDREAQMPAADDRELSRELRKCEKKFQDKVKEAEQCKAKLLKEQKALEEARSAQGKAEQEAARFRKDLAQVTEDRARLEAELEWLKKEDAQLKVERLSGDLAELQRRFEELEARALELERAAEGKAELEAKLAKLTAFQERLPEPFPQEALLRILVLDYPSFGKEPEGRVMALIEGYRALLAGEDHPALNHSNRALLAGAPEGVVLLGLEQLLLDLLNLPLARWLRTHAFRLEHLLQERRFTSPRLEER